MRYHHLIGKRRITGRVNQKDLFWGRFCQCRRQSRPRCRRKNQPVADDMTRAPIGALVIFGLDPGLSLSLRPALRQAVGFAVHFQDVDMVGQAVEERAGEAIRSGRTFYRD
jgi:hypothetical protein